MLTVVSFSSCFHDSKNDCGMVIRVVYNYNIQERNRFEEEVSKVNVWLFEKGGPLVFENEDECADNPYRTHLPEMPPGEYEVVIWALSTDYDGDFDFPALSLGTSTVDDLTARLPKSADDICDKRLNHLLVGNVDVGFPSKDHSSNAIVNVMKCPQEITVMLLSDDEELELEPERYEIRIKDTNAWLRYDGEKYREDEVVYHPFSGLEMEDKAVTGRLSISRMFEGSDSRLTVFDRKYGNEMINIDLIGLLTSESVDENKPEWSDQEYLDRQDRYSIRFYISDDKLMRGYVIVNGWKVIIDDIEL